MANIDQQIPESSRENRVIQVGHDPSPKGRIVLIDISVFGSLLKRYYEASGAKKKQKAVNDLLASEDWIICHMNHDTECRVYAEKEDIDHAHEMATARALAAVDYDVLFAPSAMFARNEKKFDVFLIRSHVILKADLKSISSKNPDTIANRIKGGADQATRLVIDINSDLDVKTLVEGLRSGMSRERRLKEILLFFRNGFYRLTRQEIMGKNIYKILR